MSCYASLLRFEISFVFFVHSSLQISLSVSLTLFTLLSISIPSQICIFSHYLQHSHQYCVGNVFARLLVCANTSGVPFLLLLVLFPFLLVHILTSHWLFLQSLFKCFDICLSDVSFLRLKFFIGFFLLLFSMAALRLRKCCLLFCPSQRPAATVSFFRYSSAPLHLCTIPMYSIVLWARKWNNLCEWTMQNAQLVVCKTHKAVLALDGRRRLHFD